MTTIPILRPEAVTPAWLADVLRAGGVNAQVHAFTAKRVGTGQIGESVRFTLDYANAPHNAPASLVGKFPSSEADSRNTGVALGNYIREVNFYKHLAASALISTPKCYFTDVDTATSEFVLMMEDLAPAEQGDQLKGCTLAQAKLALHEAANLHASHWADPKIEDLPWVTGTRAAGAGNTDPAVLATLWQAFTARYADRLSDDARRIGERLTTNFATYEAAFKGPKSLVHIDYRPDNMMFASAAGGKPLTVLDWQSLAFGCGVTDVAYFMAGALPRAERAKIERDFVREHYYERLRELGVKDYSFDTLWHDYRSRAFHLFLVAFYASVLVTQTKRGDDMFMAMIDSAVGQILDLDALWFLH